MGIVDEALHKAIDGIAGHDMIKLLNDPKPFGMATVRGIKSMIKALAPGNVMNKKYYEMSKNINSVTCGTSATGLGTFFGKKNQAISIGINESIFNNPIFDKCY
jgi:hypothetical protein